MRSALVAIALACLLAGCGGDGVFIISFTSGTIDGDPICRSNSGDFNLREEGGLVVFVAISSSTVIVLANGGRGACRDLTADTPVQVRGPRNNDRITAQSVTVQ